MTNLKKACVRCVIYFTVTMFISVTFLSLLTWEPSGLPRDFSYALIADAFLVMVAFYATEFILRKYTNLYKIEEYEDD